MAAVCSPTSASCRRRVERVVADCIVKVAPKRDAYWEKQARKVKNPRVAALTGRCSVAAEAAHFLLGGNKKMMLHVARVGRRETHWWTAMRDQRGTRVDPTAPQFPACELPRAYAKGRGGWPGRPGKPAPSRRAKQVIACARRRFTK